LDAARKDHCPLVTGGQRIFMGGALAHGELLFDMNHGNLSENRCIGHVARLRNVAVNCVAKRLRLRTEETFACTHA
jgi:hypothetical protein